MTANEFNNKYKDFLEEGHYGLGFDILEVTEYLDKEFQQLILIPDFKYMQIKLKFGMARFYCTPNSINSLAIEDKIDKIVKETDLKNKTKNGTSY